MSGHKSEQNQWLEDASGALAEAERLTGLLALSRPRSAPGLAVIQAEIQSLRREVERFRRDRLVERRRDFDPNWLEFSAWTVTT